MERAHSPLVSSWNWWAGAKFVTVPGVSHEPRLTAWDLRRQTSTSPSEPRCPSEQGIVREHTRSDPSLPIVIRVPSFPVPCVVCLENRVRWGFFTLGDARSRLGLTSKIPPLGAMLNFWRRRQKVTARHQCGNGCRLSHANTLDAFYSEGHKSVDKVFHFVLFNFQVIWGAWSDLWAFGKSERNRSKQNQITYRKGLPKVCLQQFYGQDEDWFGIFWALLVHFGLGIMREEGICQIWMFGFLRSKRSNLEVWKK